jgi:metal-responsive CopG/Arc/MetJ family transcriptional regulator
MSTPNPHICRPVTVSLPDDLVRRLDSFAATGPAPIPRSRLVPQAVLTFLAHQARQQERRV